MTLAGHAVRLAARRQARWFEQATHDPQATQARLLEQLIRANAHTAFGRDHRLGAVHSPADFAAQVPIRDYEGHRGYVDRAVAGEPSVLTSDPLTMVTMTSGTTSQPKHVPVTATFATEQATLTRLWMASALRRHPQAFDGKILMIASPAIEGATSSGMAFGSMSGVAYRRIPYVVRQRYAVPYAASLIANPDDRYLVTMRMALAENVTVIATPNPTTLLRLADVGVRHAETIVRAVHDGTLGVTDPAMTASSDVAPLRALAELRAAARPNRDRARQLADILEKHGVLDPVHCWPGLAFIGCWLGGSAGLHARHLGERFGSAVPLVDLGLIASEGRMTVPLEDATAAGTLAIGSNFYEFIPEDRIDDVNPPVLLAHQLRDGHRYYIVLTTRNGLYRYDINDIVEVRGFHNRTPKVAFVRKGRDMVNIAGEKLHLNQVQDAVADATVSTGVQPWQYRLIPDADECAYDLLIEPATRADPIAPWQVEAFADSFDRGLTSRNIEYAAKRRTGRLGPPTLYLMESGWSEAECRRDVRNGRREVQHKWAQIAQAWDDAGRAAVVGQSMPCSMA